jgi:branched-subunit amino acid transport protein
MRTGWTVLAVLSVGTYVLKAAGPLLLGNRTLPPLFERIINRLPAALLAALVVTAAAASKGRLVADARLVGLAAALVALVALQRKAGFVTVVVVAAVATALARQFGLQ